MRWLLGALLAINGLAAWHVVLTRASVERPWLLPALLIVAAALLAVQRRSRPSAQRTDAGDRIPDIRFWGALLLFAALLLTFDAAFERAASDGRGYFAQLHSLAVDRDLDFDNDIEAFGASPQMGAFPIGTALAWVPAYVAADMWFALASRLGLDGPTNSFANPFQRAAGLATMLYGFVALLWIYGFVRDRFTEATAALATLTTLFATPVIWYLTVGATMSHGVAMFAATAFLKYWWETRNRRGWQHWFVLGSLALGMTLVRPENALFVVVLGIDTAQELRDAFRVGGPRAALRFLRPHAALALAVVAMGVLILGASSDGYLEEQGLFSEWNVGEQLFSSHHGLVGGAPATGLALLGLVGLAYSSPALGIAMGLAVALHVLVGGTGPGWDAGASFGARRLVVCALPFALGLGVVIELCRRRPIVPIASVMLGFVALNLGMFAEVRSGAVTLSDPTPATRQAAALLNRVGNPLTLPYAAWFAWKHDLPLGFYDEKLPWKRLNFRAPLGESPRGRVFFGAWHGAERDDIGDYRWVPDSPVGIFVGTWGESYKLRFDVEPYAPAGSAPASVEVFLGRESLGRLQLRRGMHRYELDIEESRLPADGWLRIAWHFDRAAVPAEIQGTADRRRLAARFRSIHLIGERPPERP